jgi:hypothetical protein
VVSEVLTAEFSNNSLDEFIMHCDSKVSEVMNNWQARKPDWSMFIWQLLRSVVDSGDDRMKSFVLV